MKNIVAVIIKDLDVKRNLTHCSEVTKADIEGKQEKTTPYNYNGLFDSNAEQLVINAINRIVI